MLSVRASAAEIEELLTPQLSVAAINGPQLCVIAGHTPEIEKLQSALEKREIACKLLVTSHAFHSVMMEPAIKPFEVKVKSVQLHPPKIPIMSSVTAQWMTAEEACNPEYWSRQIRNPVRFAEGIQSLWNEHPTYVMLELGPRNTATVMARQNSPNPKKQIAIPSLGDSSIHDAEWETMLAAIGQLWLCGIEINWQNFYALENRKRIPLPTYPFERIRHWKEIIPVRNQARPTSFPSETSQPSSPSEFDYPIKQNIQKTNTNMTNRKERLIVELKDMFEDASGIEMKNASPEVSFIELGFDSLFLTQLALSISRRYGVKITFRQLNDDLSCLSALAAYLDEKLPAETPIAASPAQPAPSPASVLPAWSQPSLQQTDAQIQPSNLNLLMMQQMQLMQMMMQQMMQPSSQGAVAPAIQAHIEKSLEIKAQTKKEDITENEKAELAKPFGAIARIEKSSHAELTESQKKWLSDFMNKYISKTKKSKDHCQKYRSVLADPRVVTGFKPVIKEIIYQIVVNKSKGVHLWDLDENKYVDVLNGFGSNFFGWGSDLLMGAWKKQLEEGIELGPQTPLAGECAELICELTGYDRAAFCNTGSEAVLGAMRIARTVTGKNLIVCFNGSYHGINDEVIVRGTKSLKSFPAAAGIPKESVQNMLVLDYGTKESLSIIKERIDEIAAVMIEPIQSRRADFHPREFIHDVRKITQENGALMIFDEVITGFRLRLGGAQEYFEVKADLSTYGKVIGGNMPVGVIAGRKEFMDALDGGFWQFGDNSVPEAGVTYFAGTFVRHPLAMAAMKEVLLYLKKEGKPLYEKLNAKTLRLTEEVNAHAKQLGAPFKLVTFGSLFKAKWETEPPLTELLFALMRYKGVHIMDGFPCFLTLAFTDADVDFVIRSFKESLSELCSAGFIPTSKSNGVSSNGTSGQQATQSSLPPVPGAKLGKDANGKPAWFVPDPERPGKYLQIK
jgi:glutamate-1-semialdehyde aminotransferase/acyl carrier protein